MADFTYDSNYSPANSFSKVRFGANAPVLETDLNELQDILRHDLENFLKNSVGSGVAYNTGASINGSSLEMNNFYALVNGVPLQLTPSLNIDLTSQVVKPSTGMISYFVFLEAWSVTVGFQNKIYDYGQFNGPTIANTLIDPRVGVETSERVEQLWQIRIAQNDFANYPQGFQNPSITAQGYYTSPITGLTYTATSYDPNLYTATLTDGTIVYAIPLFELDAEPTGYTLINGFKDVSVRDSIKNLQSQIDQLGLDANPYPQYVLNNKIGTQYVQGSINLGNSMTINGDLKVLGNFSPDTLEDANIIGSFVKVNVSNLPANGGLEVERGQSPSVAIRWNETEKVWDLTDDGTAYNALVTVAGGQTINGDMTIAAGSYLIGNVEGNATTATTADNALKFAGLSSGSYMRTDVNTWTNGNMNIGGALSVAGNTVINGNLDVYGSMTTKSTQQANLGTQWIYINEQETGTPTLNAGLVITRGTGFNTAFQWNEALDTWQLSYATASGVYYDIISSMGGQTIKGDLTVSGTITSDLSGNATTATTAENALKLGGLQPTSYMRADVNTSTSGSLSISQNLGVSGNATVQGSLTVDGELNPGTYGSSDFTTTNITMNYGNAYNSGLTGGLYVERGSNPSVGMRWNESIEDWELTYDGANWHKIVSDQAGSEFGGEITFENGYGWIGYIGGDDSGNDFEIGSLTSGTHTYTLWNRADKLQMNLNLGTINASQNGIFGAGIIVSGTSTFNGVLNVDSTLSVNGPLTVKSSVEDFIIAPATWLGNSTGYIRFTDNGSANLIESFNGAQNGNQDLTIAGAYGNTGGNLNFNFTTVNSLGTLKTNGLVVNDNNNLYFGPAGDNTDSIFFSRTNDTTDSSGLHLYIGDNGGEDYPDFLQSKGNGDYFHVTTTNGTDILYGLSTGDVLVGRNLSVANVLYIGDSTDAIPTHAAMSNDNNVLVINPNNAISSGTLVQSNLSIVNGVKVTSTDTPDWGAIHFFDGGADFGYDGGTDKTFYLQHRTGTNTNVGTTSFVDANDNALFSISTNKSTYAYGDFGVQGVASFNNTVVSSGSYLSFGTYFENTDSIYFTRVDDAPDSSGLHLYIGDNGGNYPNYLQKGGSGDYLQIATTNGTDILRGISTGDVFVGRNLVVPNAVFMGTNTTTLPSMTALSVNNKELLINPNNDFSNVTVGSDLNIGNTSVSNAWVNVAATSDHGYQLDGKPVLGLFPGWDNDNSLWLNAHSDGSYHISLVDGVNSLGNFDVIGGNISAVSINAPDSLSLDLYSQASTLTAGATYYYGVTSVTAGESLVGPIEHITLSDNSHSIELQWSEVSGAYAYNIYRGTSASNLKLLTQVSSFASSNATWIDTGVITPSTAGLPAANTTGGDITGNALTVNTANVSTLNASSGLVIANGASNTIGGNTIMSGDVLFDGKLFFGVNSAEFNTTPDAGNNEDPAYIYTTYDQPGQTGVHMVLGSGTLGAPISGTNMPTVTSSTQLGYYQIEDSQGATLFKVDAGGNVTINGNLNYKGLSGNQIYEVHDSNSLTRNTGEVALDPLAWTNKAMAYSPANNDVSGDFFALTPKIGIRHGDYAISVRARLGPFVQDNTEAALYQSQALGIVVRYYTSEDESTYFDQTEWFDTNAFMYGTSWYYTDGKNGDMGNNIYNVYTTQYVLKYFTTQEEGQRWIDTSHWVDEWFDDGIEGLGWDGDGDEWSWDYLVKSGYWQYYYYPVTNAVWTPIVTDNKYYIDYTNFYTNFTFQKQMLEPGTQTPVFIDHVKIGVISNQDNYPILVDSIVVQPVHPGVLQ